MRPAAPRRCSTPPQGPPASPGPRPPALATRPRPPRLPPPPPAVGPAPPAAILCRARGPPDATGRGGCSAGACPAPAAAARPCPAARCGPGAASPAPARPRGGPVVWGQDRRTGRVRRMDSGVRGGSCSSRTDGHLRTPPPKVDGEQGLACSGQTDGQDPCTRQTDTWDPRSQDRWTPGAPHKTDGRLGSVPRTEGHQEPAHTRGMDTRDPPHPRQTSRADRYLAPTCSR